MLEELGPKPQIQDKPLCQTPMPAYLPPPAHNPK